jgi:hypothetical protein
MSGVGRILYGNDFPFSSINREYYSRWYTDVDDNSYTAYKEVLFQLMGETEVGSYGYQTGDESASSTYTIWSRPSAYVYLFDWDTYTYRTYGGNTSQRDANKFLGYGFKNIARIASPTDGKLDHSREIYTKSSSSFLYNAHDSHPYTMMSTAFSPLSPLSISYSNFTYLLHVADGGYVLFDYPYKDTKYYTGSIYNAGLLGQWPYYRGYAYIYGDGTVALGLPRKIQDICMGMKTGTIMITIPI